MTSTKRNQVAGQHQSHNQAYRRRLVSPGDITYVLASLLLSGMRLLPTSQHIPTINKISVFLAGALCSANVHSAKTIRENLSVLGIQRSRDKADIQRLLSIIVWNALVINSLPVFSREQIANLTPIDGTSCLNDGLDGNRPVLIWSYHFGVHPVIVAAILHARGYPIHAITHVHRMPATASAFRRRYLHRLRRVDDQFPMIDPREGPQRAMLDVLRHKECLYVTPDYMIPEDEWHSNSAFEVPIDFLGRKARLQTGGLRLAKRLKARVVTVLYMPGNGNKRGLVVEPFDLPTPGLTPTELQQDLQVCMRRLEAQVLAQPHLWLDLKRDDLSKRLSPTWPGCNRE